MEISHVGRVICVETATISSQAIYGGKADLIEEIVFCAVERALTNDAIVAEEIVNTSSWVVIWHI